MLAFDHSWAQQLDGTFFAVAPEVPPDPQLVLFNDALASELGLDAAALRADAAAVLSGARVPDGAQPLAQAYAGHQFGHLSPQLGDGRAVLLGELVDDQGRRYDLQLKGSGRTPFSRRGDGKATLGPMLREYVMGEAMHALGIPTTRALAVTTTGERVRRQAVEPGAVLARVASSHLRIGTFEFFAIRGDVPVLEQLVRYALWRHGPDPGDDVPALVLLRAVMQRQARLVAEWMGVGFIHGVMNTDNVAISGETLDFGPCAFMDHHDPATVFSSIDDGGRYAYGNQPRIMGWNLSRLASALLPVVDDEPDTAVAKAQEVLDGFGDLYDAAVADVWRRKLGLVSQQDGDVALVEDWLSLLRTQHPDHTGIFRHLAAAARGDEAPFVAAMQGSMLATGWLRRWTTRLAGDGALAERADAMDAVNPLVVPRNHRVEEALAAAVSGDLAPVERLVREVGDPFTAREGVEDLTEPAPKAFTECYQTFCGT